MAPATISPRGLSGRFASAGSHSNEAGWGEEAVDSGWGEEAVESGEEAVSPPPQAASTTANRLGVTGPLILMSLVIGP